MGIIWANELNLGMNHMPQVQDCSLKLLMCRPVCYHYMLQLHLIFFNRGERERERENERERDFEVWYIALAHRQACFADC